LLIAYNSYYLKKVMQLYLIRHAQSENNALWERTAAEQGRNMDPALSPLGALQARALSHFLSDGRPGVTTREDYRTQSGFALTHIYSSLMQRAVQTGSLIAETLNLPLHGWTDWHECGGIYLQDEESGALIGYPGKDRAFFKSYFPSLVWPPGLDSGGWWNRPFEEKPERWQRAQRVLDELLARHAGSDDRIAIVTHGSFYNYFLKTLLGIPPGAGIWFEMRNAAISRIDFIDSEIKVVYQNRYDFMPDELISFS
jgi:2,3-bisphosphoglycerate-dependent phosphoglycerate mutase